MARKQIRVSRRMLFTWFMLAGFIFLFAPQNLTNKFQFAFARIFRWPLSIGRNISLSARAQQPLIDVVSRREYDKLQNHLANLTEALIQGRQEFEKLYGLYNRYVWDDVEFMLADVITASIEGTHCELIINRGENDGLSEGQFVLGDNSIIGTISVLSSRTARVKLITDPTSKIAVKIAELKTVMKGDGDNLAKVEMAKHKVKIGEDVFALKKPGFLDAPIKVGTVVKCESNDKHPLLWDIMIKPACKIEILNDVAVIIMNPQ